MPTYKIRGINIDFPYEAYDCQLVYMDKVIESLQTKSNALLESPTGTGKTLCLLCATLAWRRSLGPFSIGKKREPESMSQPRSGSSLPTIVYASRTHSQLRQVIQELKRTTYRPKMVILGSREQLCINEDVRLLRGKAQNHACRYLCKRKPGRRGCDHFFGVDDFMRKNPHLGEEPIDIEDLVDIGRRLGPCPYYLSRELHMAVDILFVPYNYLIDRSFRKTLTINWDSSILIFDEAHNLESICADAASFDLSSGLLTACISEAKSCIDLSVTRRDESNDKSRNPDDFAILRALLLKLEKRIADLPIQSRDLGLTKPGPFLHEFLADLNITYDTSSRLINIVEAAVLLLEEDKQSNTAGNTCRLDSIANILRIVFREKGNAHAKFYRVHVQEAKVTTSGAEKGKTSRTLSWWCFNPGMAMEAFSQMGVGSIILTSGTLSPMDSFAQELKLDFPIQLQNPHVISSSQLWAGLVTAGPSGRTFNSSYRNRDSPEYKQELGNAIANFSRMVPDGLLVFFPSYYLMDQLIACWKERSPTNSMTIWERICKHKKPVVEPRESSLFTLAIQDYMSKLKDDSTSGAVFFAVCRGKVSEGLDFADHAGRAVVIIGMPFASSVEPKVRLKREYLDKQAQLQRDKQKCLTGEEWYNQQASRAVNQAVGRVIRHRNDYGAIIFCDERFSHSTRRSEISAWIQPHIKCYSNFGDVVFTLSRFFRDGGTRGSAKLNLGQCKDAEKVGEAQPMERSYIGYSQPMPTNNEFTLKSLSSSLVNSQEDPSPAREIPPANRSSLTPKEIQDLRESLFIRTDGQQKELLLSERKSLHLQYSDIFRSTCKTSTTEMLGRESVLVPCLVKKRKKSNADYDIQRYLSDDVIEISEEVSEPRDCLSHSLVKPKCLSSGTDHCLVDSPISQKDSEIKQERKTENVGQKRKCQTSTALPSANEETRGFMFLSQVKEKLSTAEYKEFIDSVKALKSKAVGINDVLQSIMRLFCDPERLPLLHGFRDFVPTKYHDLYDHYYFEANHGKLDDQKKVVRDELRTKEQGCSGIMNAPENIKTRKKLLENVHNRQVPWPSQCKAHCRGVLPLHVDHCSKDHEQSYQMVESAFIEGQMRVLCFNQWNVLPSLGYPCKNMSILFPEKCLPDALHRNPSNSAEVFPPHE